MRIYFMMGFLLMLFSLCFSCNTGKDSFILDKFFTIKSFDFYTKKFNIALRLAGHIKKHIKRLTTKEEKYAFSPQKVGAADQQK